jgi:hypothetical protein
MVKCPKCKKEIAKSKKSWIYGQFEVRLYSCDNCGTDFREYTRAGKHSFTLKCGKGNRWTKA